MIKGLIASQSQVAMERYMVAQNCMCMYRKQETDLDIWFLDEIVTLMAPP